MVEMQNLFGGAYGGKNVLITGHTGFKGTWLSIWLSKMGANIVGYSLAPNTSPSHFEEINFVGKSVIGDIRDRDKMQSVFDEFKPEIVFHLAAQPIVRESYRDPVETYDVNVMGTLYVLESCRKTPSVASVVVISSDKAYENKEQIWGYREEDSMGGYDPYSSSKGCTELVVSSYRKSYFNLDDYGTKHSTLVSSCRAGNVIGGGDWAKDRLLTDIMIAVSSDQLVDIRNPHSTRPWQHVLEPLSGYLSVGQKLIEKNKRFACGWNFGPPIHENISVEQVVKSVKKYWNKIDYRLGDTSIEKLHEAKLLKLDCTKAYSMLNWKNVWDSDKTFKMVTLWYKEFYENNRILSEADLNEYVKDAISQNLKWTI